MELGQIQMAFEEHGFRVVGLKLQPGIQLSNTTSLTVTHRLCGHQRRNSISLQKAQKKEFKICPKCHGVEERRFTWTHDELSAKVKHDIGATLLGKKSVIYSRVAKEGCVTAGKVKCDKCGSLRNPTVKVLLRGKDNGCDKCAGNQVNPSAIVVKRALECGLRILNPETYKGGSTVLKFQCLNCGAIFSQTWQNQRKRPCGQCTRPFGEALLEALCRFYLPEGDWQSQYAVAGLLKRSPRTIHYYDIASLKLKIVLENHSSIHSASAPNPFFGMSNLDLANRRKIDVVKKNAISNKRAAVYGWKYGLVWFELENIRKMRDADGDYLPKVVPKFVDVMRQCGHELAHMREPTMAELQDYFGEFKSLKTRALARDLVLQNEFWKGRAEHYDFKHDCGCNNNAIPNDIENEWKIGRSGCGWCDKTGRLGEWRNFVELIAEHSWHVENPFKPRLEREFVEFTCSKHPQCGVRKATRSRLREECRKNAMLLPTCLGCRSDIQTRKKVAYNNMKVAEVLVPFDMLLREFGMKLVEWVWKGSSTSGGINLKYKIEYLKCGHQRDVFLNATKYRLKKRLSTNSFCTECKSIELKSHGLRPMNKI